MRLYPQIAPIILGLLFSYSSSFGQTLTDKELKKEMIRHALEEKMGDSIKENEKYELGSRATIISDERVSTNPTYIQEREISVSYDPADSNHIVLSFMQTDSFGNHFPIYYSNNAGNTWTLSNFDTRNIRNLDFPNRRENGFGDPIFAWDKNGTVYFSWIYMESSTVNLNDSLYWTLNWAYSNDNGHTWLVKPNHFIGQGAVHAATFTVYKDKDGMLDRDWFAVDNGSGPHQGNLYCSFTCFPPDGSNTFIGVRTKMAGVDTFGPVIKAINTNSLMANVETDKNGVVHISAADLSALKIKYTRSTDGGASFSTPIIVGNVPFINHTSIVVRNRERAAVNIATDGVAGTGDNVHIVWSDYPSGTVNSYYIRSSDGGITWSTPSLLNSQISGYKTLMPTVAANSNNVAISFTAIDANDSANYYEINSTDNGATFSPPIRLSSASCNYHAIGAASSTSPLSFGDYNRSVRSLCNVNTTWEDCRDGHSSKVYFAKTNYCTEGVRELSRVNGAAQLLDMFPNPTSDKVTIKIQSVAQDISISITDMAGHLALSKVYHLHSGTNEETMAITGLAKGIYLLSLNDEEGIIASRTLVVR